MSSRKKAAPSAKDLIRGGKLPEDKVTICLRGDLQVEFEQLEDRLTKALGSVADSLDGTGAAELAEQIEALRRQMEDHSITFTLRAHARPAWKQLLAEHPPRKGDDGAPLDDDRYVGVNTETFFAALVRSSVVDPELDDDDWRLLLDERLTDRQFDNLSNAAWNLNRRDVDIPFSRAASKIRSSGSA